MPMMEIPTAQELKVLCGRTGLKSLVKTKNDLDKIFFAVQQAEYWRQTRDARAMGYLRAVRKECCAWLFSTSTGGVRASKPHVTDLMNVVHARLLELAEQLYQKKNTMSLKDVAMKTGMGLKAGHTGKHLQESYSLERFTKQHWAKPVFQGAQSKWKTSTTRLSFEDWVQHVFIPMGEDDPSGLYLQVAPKQVTDLKNSKGVKYCSDKERESYVITISGGKIVDCEGNDFTTANKSTVHSGAGWAIFVMAPDNTLYANNHVLNEFHHSSFLAGAPTQSAGELVVEDGTLRCITSKTGHYQAGKDEFVRMLFWCHFKGVKLDAVLSCPEPFGNKKWYFAKAVLQNGGDINGLTEQPAPKTPPIAVAKELQGVMAGHH